MAKINISIDDGLLDRLDRYADENYMSRSGLISISVNQYLASNEVFGLVKDMSLAMRKIADSGQVDQDTLDQLRDFERMANYISKSRN